MKTDEKLFTTIPIQSKLLHNLWLFVHNSQGCYGCGLLWVNNPVYRWNAQAGGRWELRFGDGYEGLLSKKGQVTEYTADTSGFTIDPTDCVVPLRVAEKLTLLWQDDLMPVQEIKTLLAKFKIAKTNDEALTHLFEQIDAQLTTRIDRCDKLGGTDNGSR